MSSMNTITNLSKYGRKTLFIKNINVARALVKPSGIPIPDKSSRPILLPLADGTIHQSLVMDTCS